MATYWGLITFVLGIVYAFQNGIGFALNFIGICWVPMVAVGAAKWGFLRGDSQQKIGVPAIAVALLLFTLWLSIGLETHIFGVTISGLLTGLISAGVGLTIPLRMATR